MDSTGLSDWRMVIEARPLSRIHGLGLHTPTDYADNVVEHAVASPASADTESPASVGTSLCPH